MEPDNWSNDYEPMELETFSNVPPPPPPPPAQPANKDRDLVTQLMRKVRNQSMELVEMQRKLDTQASYIKSCESQIKGTDTASIRQHETDEEKNTISRLNSTVKALEGKLSAAESKIKNLNRTVALAKNSNSTNSRRNKSGGGGGVSGLLKQNNDLQNTVNSLQKEKRQLEKSLGAETLRAEEAVGYIAVLEEALELKAKDLGLSLGDEGGQQVKLLTEIARLKGELESKNKLLGVEQDSNKDMTRKLAEISEENGSLSRCMMEAEEKLAVMTVELQRAGSSDLLSDLRKLESEKQGLVDYIQDTLERIAAMKTELDTTTSDLQEVKQSNIRQEEVITALKQDVAKLTLSESEVKSQLESLLGEKNGIEMDLMTAREKLDKALGEVGDREGELDEMESTQSILIQKCSDKDAECEKLQRLVDDVQGEKERIAVELVNAKNQINIFKEKAETEEDLGKVHRKNVNELFEKLSRAETELEIKEARIASLTSSKEEMEASLLNNIRRASEAEVHLPHLQVEVDALRHLRGYVGEIEEFVRANANASASTVMKKDTTGGGGDNGGAKSAEIEIAPWAQLPQLDQVLPGFASELRALVTSYKGAITNMNTLRKRVEELEGTNASDRSVLYSEIHDLQRKVDGNELLIQRLRPLEVEVEALRVQIASKSQELIDMNTTLSATKIALDDALRKCSDLNIESEKVGPLEAMVSALTEEKQNLRTELNQANATIIKLTDDEAAARLDKRVFKEKVIALENTITAHDDAVQKYKNAEVTQVELQRKIDVLEASMKDTTIKLETSQRQHSDVLKIRDGLQVELGEKQAENKALHSDLSAAREMIKAGLVRYQDVSRSSHLMIRRGEISLTDLIQDMLEIVLTASSRVTEMEKRIRKSEDERLELQSKLSSSSAIDVNIVTNRLSKVEADNVALTANLLNCESKLGEAERKVQRASNLEAEVEKIREECHALKLSVKQHQVDEHALREEVIDMEKQLVQVLEELELTNEELNNKNETVEHLKRELDDMTEALDEMELANAENTRTADALLEQELLETLTENEQLRQKVSTLERDRVNMNGHNSTGGSNIIPSSPSVSVNRHGSIAIDINNNRENNSYKGTPSSYHHRHSYSSSSARDSMLVPGSHLLPRELYTTGEEDVISESDRESIRLEECLNRIQHTFASLQRS